MPNPIKLLDNEEKSITFFVYRRELK